MASRTLNRAAVEVADEAASAAPDTADVTDVTDQDVTVDEAASTDADEAAAEAGQAAPGPAEVVSMTDPDGAMFDIVPAGVQALLTLGWTLT